MQTEITSFIKAIKYSAILVGSLMLGGIATLRVIARDKDEDITGIVAPALLIMIISTIVAVCAAVIQRRLQQANEGR